MNYKLQDLIERLDELIPHLDESQGSKLKDFLDSTKKPEGVMEIEGSPKGISVEKVSVMKKPEGFDDKVDEAIEGQDPENPLASKDETELSDEELEELLKSKLKG